MSESLRSRATKILGTLFERYDGPSFSLRTWDGRCWRSPGRGEPECAIVFHSEGALRSLLVRPSEITLGEAFLSKKIDVEGDIFSVFDVVEHVFQCARSQRQRILEVVSGVFGGMGHRWRHGKTHSIERDHAAISYHYDQPVEFYRPWLEDSLAYSCAYFESPADTINEAQTGKLELICRKLRLQPGAEQGR